MIISDLVIDSVSISVAAVLAGGSLSVTDTTLNIGNAPSVTSTTRYWLSTNVGVTTGLVPLNGSRSVPALAAGTRSNGAAVSVVIPASVARGNYFLGACADDGNGVVESKETNNCRATPITVQ
ncbi:MAG: hypothetical protein L0387_11285 [Acidobacteria bacterium]|nr:hypothetical protein [Acidobacteriota bacterium]MCI0622229.1 hypothetical protein [Acidobacteriota bacterium]MCI0717947.1 hypothetical protein [Acidobacteriota bacterium]